MSARRTRSKRVLWATVLVVVAAGAVWATAAIPRGDDVPWVEVSRDDLSVGVEVAGTLESENSSKIGPPNVDQVWNFKISMLAPEGQRVEKGTPILAFDVSELEQRLRERRNESEQAAKEIEKLETDLRKQRLDNELALANARATLRKAELKVEGPEELIADLEREKAELDLEIARIEVARLEASVESAERSGEAQLEVRRAQKARADRQVREIERAIERMTVVAPRDGTIVYVSQGRDEKPKVGDQVWRNRDVVELPDLTAMAAVGEIDEADAGVVAVGQTVRFRLDAHPDIEYVGRVESIWSTVQRKSWRNPLKVVKIDIELDETDPERMLPGMRLRGTIESERCEDAVVAPARAVFPTVDGPVVYRKTLVGHERVEVELGARSGDRVEIVSGVRPGDRLSARDLGGDG